MTETPGIHLIGSIPLADTETVFRTVCESLGPWLKRLPDGETGVRHRWIYWQRDMLLEHPAMELDPEAPGLRLTQWDGTLIRVTPLIRFRPGADLSAVTFDTGYAAAAKESYAVFARLKQEGVIPAHVRFQVCLPTAMASGFMYVAPGSLMDYLPVYERSLILALEEIQDSIPAGELSIQWDICQEILVFEDYFPNRPDGYKELIFEELHRLGNAVRRDVELGYHFCYGTPNDEHLVTPKDLAVSVEMANGMLGGVHRPVDFIHMPVPKARTDGEYFMPLSGLTTTSETALYLGLIHHDDSEGDMARMQAAKRTTDALFGVASECGWGRTDPARLPGLLTAHRQAVVQSD